MNAETSMYSNDIFLMKDELIKRLRALDPSIDVQEKGEILAGHLIEATSPDGNIPTVNIIINELNSKLIVRLEIIGNITQYIVDEVITYLQKNFNLSYLEVTDPRTGLIKFSLSKKNKSSNLFEIYKRELFKFHYPRDDGRLILLYDQGTLWVHPVVKTVTSKPQIMKKPFTPKPSGIKREVSTKTPTTPIKTPVKEPSVPEHKVESPAKEVAEQPDAPKTLADSPALKRATKTKLDLSKNEQTILKLVESKPNKKVQSKGLRKELPSMDQDTIRNILRSLVAKGLLYVRSAWYIVKEDPSEDTWDIASETPIEERLQSLTPKERKIYEILEKRAGNKAQARMLIKETKMTKENLKKLLRNMVAKDVLFVYAAWYCIKE